MTIEAPVHEVKSITGWIEFTDGSKVEFGVGPDHDWANGQQPAIGKSVDIRTAIVDALNDESFWDDGLVECPNGCGERVEEDDIEHWPNLKEPVSMCSSCVHNARRSGWEPGQ